MSKRKTVLFGSAYSLIEILVALTIIGILFGAGFVIFRDFSRRQALVSVARQIRGDLKLAQEYALSGKKPEEGGCILLDGYRVKFSSTSYSIYSICSGGEQEVEGKKNIGLPTGISMTYSQNSVTFRVLGKGADLSGVLVITLTQAATGKTNEIKVSPTGKIE
jgi:prepilin-type N-terminal cleavage/methylation domain-containing protein